MKVIIARKKLDAELEAFERGIPPRGRDTVLIATDAASSAHAGRGLMLHPDDVIELPDAKLGRYYDEIMRALRPCMVIE